MRYLDELIVLLFLAMFLFVGWAAFQAMRKIDRSNKRKVVWIEPRQGRLPNGEERTLTVTLSMSAEDVVKVQRYAIGGPTDLTDEELLETFITIHHARLIKGE